MEEETGRRRRGRGGGGGNSADIGRSQATLGKARKCHGVKCSREPWQGLNRRPPSPSQSSKSGPSDLNADRPSLDHKSPVLTRNKTTTQTGRHCTHKTYKIRHSYPVSKLFWPMLQLTKYQPVDKGPP
ncbi:hypothetical protein ElyMa_004976100 [Elysia marginata]|uniref:Uncharacterized protein n=1 Tax=Elysia marginata TaxID=1093978 RepID=A0AAV4J305_9GAST|nr:hypothetical protein ElyMa_004976100 [Elysia marginata]